MATTSRLKAVKSKLNTLLEADLQLAGVQVTRGGHPGADQTREDVWIDRVRWTENAANLGGADHKRDQFITAEIAVRIEQEGNDPEAIDDRCLEIVNEIEETLRANPRLDGEVLYGGISGGEQSSWQEQEGRVAVARLDATYRARKGA